MSRKNVNIALGIFSFIMMIGGLFGYLYHTDCCGMKEKCHSMMKGCCGKSGCCCEDED
jgi:hypothetical protein